MDCEQIAVLYDFRSVFYRMRDTVCNLVCSMPMALAYVPAFLKMRTVRLGEPRESGHY
jgi:hypothetical protein